MPDHNYTAEQALEMLLEKLRNRDQTLAKQIQEAIDAGKDVREKEPSQGNRKKARMYRKKVPYSREEALKVALDALQAYFVEQPLFVGSAVSNLAKAAIGVPKIARQAWMYSSATTAGEPEPVDLEGIDQEKSIAIEIQTETQISKSEQEILPLNPRQHDAVVAQRRQLDALRQLTNFKKN